MLLLTTHRPFPLIAWITLIFMTQLALNSPTSGESPVQLRLATYNASLYGKKSGEILERLSDGIDTQASQIATIIQTVRPDILLINEIDHDEDSATARMLAEKFIAVGQHGLKPMFYPYIYSAPSNTGIDSGMDLDGDGQLSGPGDAWGFGVYPGQYSMAVLSRFPIDFDNTRTFQTLLWRNFPAALRPIDPTNQKSFYDDTTWEKIRLSSKNHIDVPVQVGDQVIHVLACHPTPPVFDGPEDRNGRRNHDEIRFWNEYVENPVAPFLIDDQGRAGGLGSKEMFFIAGDLNSDPADGDSLADAIKGLLECSRLVDAKPTSDGGAEAGGGSTENQLGKGDPKFDTASFRNGNMRIDYVLPSRSLAVKDAKVFWPTKQDPARELISASDHRMVWVDVELPK